MAGLVAMLPAALALRSADPNPERLGLRLDPEKLATPEAAAFDQVTFEIRPGGTAAVRLAPGEAAPSMAALDLTDLVPRVPRLARGNAALTKIALIQREFNRNEIHADLGGGRDFSVANNCLKQGLWEVKVAHKEADRTSLQYHAWFTFPPAPYVRLFEKATGLKYSDYESLLVNYPGLGGLPVPLAQLRTVSAEKDAGAIATHADEAVQRLSEQQGKTKYVLSPGMERYGDFTKAANQPIALAKFAEPGRYTTDDPMKFDLSWLSAPKSLTWRRVSHAGVEGEFPEIEVVFANGNRLVAADARLDGLQPVASAPDRDPGVLKLVCGIGTPDIQSTIADRAREMSEDRPRYLMFLDAKGNHIDNHFAGVDAVYFWREAGNPGAVHLWLVSYERIAFVAHLSAAWAPPPAGKRG
jgi:hypothetical protein